jgi:hypothetical protein
MLFDLASQQAHLFGVLKLFVPPAIICLSHGVTASLAAGDELPCGPVVLPSSGINAVAQSAASWPGSVSCSAASCKILSEGMISGMGGCSIGMLPDACRPGKTLPRSPHVGSPSGAVSSADSSIPARDTWCRRTRSRIRCRLGWLPAWGRMRMLALGAAGGSWFG